MGFDARPNPQTALTGLWQLMTVFTLPDYPVTIERNGKFYHAEKHAVGMRIPRDMPDGMYSDRMIADQFSHHFNTQVMALGEQCSRQIGVNIDVVRQLRMDDLYQYNDLKMIVPEFRLHELLAQFDTLPPVNLDKPDGYIGSFLDIEMYMIRGIETGLLFSTRVLWMYVQKPFRVDLRSDKQDTIITGSASYCVGLDNPQLWMRVV